MVTSMSEKQNSQDEDNVVWKHLDVQRVFVDLKQSQVAGYGGRVETGAVQMRGDWPGLFVRGDDSLELAAAIHTVLEHVVDPGMPEDTLENQKQFELHYSLSTLRNYLEIITTHVCPSKNLDGDAAEEE